MPIAYDWYQSLAKPFWAPPGWLFAPVWTVLYALIAVSFGYVAYLFIRGRISFRILLPFLLNLFFNAIFTYLQFELKNNFLAAADILLVLGTLVWAMLVARSQFRWVAYLNYPYLLWVIFASVLQLTITVLNL